MRKQGMTGRECAARFGVSHQRIAQVLRVMKDRYGMDVNAERLLPYWSISDVATILNCRKSTVKREIVRAGLVEGVDLRRRPRVTGDGKHGHATRIYYSGITKLREYSTKTCSVCESEFISHHKSVTVCKRSDCRALLKYGHRIPEVLRGPALEIQQRAFATEVPDDDWARIRQAIKGTGLSMMQVFWIVKCDAIPTRPDPTKKWRGDPVTLVSRTHIKIVEEVYKKHGRIIP